MIHLVPEILEEEAEVDGLGDYPLGMVMLVLGFLLVFLIEQVFFPHDHGLPSRMQQETFRLKLRSFLNPRAARSQIPIGSARIPEEVSMKSEKMLIGGAPVPNEEHAAPRKTWAASIGSMKDALLLLLAFSAHGILEGVLIGFQVR